MRRRFCVVLAALALAGAACFAQKLPWQTNDTGIPNAPLVRFLYPQQVNVTAGKPQTIEMHFRIQSGLHINSHVPLQKSLIATDLNTGTLSGIRVDGIDFPTGSPYAFAADPAETLSVYTGELVVKVRIVAQHGNHLMQGSLRYQACDTNTCFPPRTVPAAVDVIAQ